MMRKVASPLMAVTLALVAMPWLGTIRTYAAATLLPNGEQCFQSTSPTSGGLYGPLAVLGTISAGSGYPNNVYTNVPLTGGSGFGATANITVVLNVVTNVTVINPGSHYAGGDTLSAATANLGGSGAGFSVPVSSVSTTGTGMLGLLGTIIGGGGGTAGTYPGVALTGGSGSGAAANVTVAGGTVTAVAITNPGLQYQVADILSAASGSIGGVTGFSVPVSSVTVNSALAGGQVFMYVPNTVTTKQTWKNATQTILNTNPITLDQNGCAIIYGTGSYRQILQDSLGNTVWDQLTTDTSAQQNVFWAGLAGGTPNAITLTDPGFNATDGTVINFTALSSNTGNTTVNPSSFGNVPLLKDTSAGSESLVGGEVVANNPISALYRLMDNSFHILNPVTQIANNNILGSFWTDITDADGTMNAHINPFRDRLFVDDGALENGAWNGGAGGLASTRSGIAINQFTWNWAPREASLLSISSWGEIAIVGMTVANRAGRSGDPHSPTGSAPIGVAGFSLNNVTSNPLNTWGGYFETLRATSGVGTAFAVELDTGNTGPIIDFDPYTPGLTPAAGLTVGLWNACGGSANTVVTYTNCSAAMSFIRNGGNWRKGIVFVGNAVDTSVGTSGGGVAMDMPQSMEFRWFANPNDPVTELWGSQQGLRVNNPSGGGGHLGVTGAAPSISACGTGAGSASGTDHQGFVVEGTSATGCTIVFATTFSAIPVCIANLFIGAVSAAAVAPVTVTTSSVAFIHATENNAQLSWMCSGN